VSPALPIAGPSMESKVRVTSICTLSLTDLTFAEIASPVNRIGGRSHCAFAINAKSQAVVFGGLGYDAAGVGQQNLLSIL
jgi:hypothetical protein